MLAGVLFAALVCSPLTRHLDPVWMKGLHSHTLIKLDGIAIGSLLALGLYTLTLSRRVWLWIGVGAFVLGMTAAATIAGGTSLLDTALATGFAGAVLAAMASTGARNPLSAALRRGPLAFYGRISYGLYMTHIMIFVFHWQVRPVDEQLRHGGKPGGCGASLCGYYGSCRRAVVRL